MRQVQGCADGTGVGKSPGSTRLACRNANPARGGRDRVLEFRRHSVGSSLRNRNLSCGRRESELLSLSARAPASSMHVRRGQKRALQSPAWVLLLFGFLASSPCRASPASLPLPETPHVLRLLQTVVFHNASDTDIEGASFLGDVAVVSLDTRTWKFKFLQPWGVSGLTPEEWDLLLKIIKGYFLGFVQTINKMVVFLKGSLSPDYQVFTHKTPPAPDSLLLVCRVTGFYPRPINVSWLQDDKELPSSDFNSTEILPNHDLTYQIRSTLVIKSADEHSYACRVQHISLGVKIIPWGAMKASAQRKEHHQLEAEEKRKPCRTAQMLSLSTYKRFRYRGGKLWRKTAWSLGGMLAVIGLELPATPTSTEGTRLAKPGIRQHRLFGTISLAVTAKL
ncbi:uncharacterized protein LOC128408910 isoform X3 [Podarcis raffonei]|uniref:uncharacterized protein LOC128408910 isoform X3 n=1 Tax=Podarcis raffonei TaxID=65483 RepID=UPI0023297527|nr:uncharacterized protein LOC128408910 isoform X3 [Podarcis raffonei]